MFETANPPSGRIQRKRRRKQNKKTDFDLVEDRTQDLHFSRGFFSGRVWGHSGHFNKVEGLALFYSIFA